jgi:xanthine dehydrogenase accessory factor
MMDHSIFEKLVEVEKNNRSAVMCTIVRSSGSTPRHAGSKMLVYPDGKIYGSIGGGEIEIRVIEEAKNVLLDGRSKLMNYSFVDPAKGDVGICGGEAEIFMDPIQPKPSVLIIGCGHVGKALAHLAKWLEFRVTVSDDRVELCNPATIPEADEYVPCSMGQIPEKIAFNKSTYVILTTRGSDTDIEGLPSILKQDYAYLGIIGSQRRWLTTRKALVRHKINVTKINEIHSPIGLELHAETPEEIAVSIMAEIISVRNLLPDVRKNKELRS